MSDDATYEANTVPELQAELDRRKIEYKSADNKPDLIALLEADDGGNNRPDPAYPDDKVNEKLSDQPDKEPLKDSDGNPLPPNFTGGHAATAREETDDPRVVVVDGQAIVTGAQPEPTYDEKDGLIGPKGPTAAPAVDGDSEADLEAFAPAKSVVSDIVGDTTKDQVRTFDDADVANRNAFAASQAHDIKNAELSLVDTAALEAELARRKV